MTEVGYSLAAALAKRAPRRLLDPLVNLAVGAYVATHPRRTRSIDRNLARVWAARGGFGPPPRASETYRLFARALLDFLASPSAGPNALPRVRLSDDARLALASAREAGAPTVLVSGHFGPWERALQWVSSQVGGVHALAAPHRFTAVERLFASRRAVHGVRTLPCGRGAQTALRRLRAGGWIAALADRASRPGKRSIDGAPPGLVPLDSGPLLLAQRAGALVLPGVAWIESDGALGVHFDAPFSLEPGRGGIPLPQALARLQRFFDDHVRAHPTQWYEWRGAAGAG
jgi:KDO2-lipid IV(A) lauroyltransferase